MVRIEPVSDQVKAAEAINEVLDAHEQNREKVLDVAKDVCVGEIKDETHKLRALGLAQKLKQDHDETEFGFRRQFNLYDIFISQKI